MNIRFVNRKSAHGMLCAALLPALAAGCVGCNISGAEENISAKSDSLAIMTWNVQALFDGTGDGIEYDDYRESAGWTREKYRGRLNVIAAAIGAMEQKPDIIALQELESAQVVKDLAAALSIQGYRWTHFANIPGMALGLGLLSRFPISGARSHSVTIDGDLAPRPMLEAHISTAGDNATEAETKNASLALFVCHWKSKLGGDDATEKTRRASARIILRRMRELLETDPHLPVIVMGDLNENYDEFYRRSGTVISALLPDDPRAAEFAGLYGLDEINAKTALLINQLQKDFIIVSKNKPPAVRYFPGGVFALYTPWTTELENGSYYYKNDWETIDHFLLSAQLFDECGWDFDQCAVLNVSPFASEKGLPMGYNPRTGNGLSDHLPLLLVLKMRRE